MRQSVKVKNRHKLPRAILSAKAKHVKYYLHLWAN